MNPENIENNKIEGEQNPEIPAEVQKLDQKAEEVVRELDEVDLKNIESADKEKLKAKLMMVLGAIMVIGGTSMAIYESPSFSISNLNDAEDAIKTVFNSKFGFDAMTAVGGVTALLQHGLKLKKLFGEESESKGDQTLGK